MRRGERSCPRSVEARSAAARRRLAAWHESTESTEQSHSGLVGIRAGMAALLGAQFLLQPANTAALCSLGCVGLTTAGECTCSRLSLPSLARQLRALRMRAIPAGVPAFNRGSVHEPGVPTGSPESSRSTA